MHDDVPLAGWLGDDSVDGGVKFEDHVMIPVVADGQRPAFGEGRNGTVGCPPCDGGVGLCVLDVRQRFTPISIVVFDHIICGEDPDPTGVWLKRRCQFDSDLCAINGD